MCPERIKTQKDQQKAWLQQQIRERQQAEQDRLAAERSAQAALEALDRKALELDESERKTRRQIQKSTTKFNLNLVSQLIVFLTIIHSCFIATVF